jgi:hypothetical protein
VTSALATDRQPSPYQICTTTIASSNLYSDHLLITAAPLLLFNEKIDCLLSSLKKKNILSGRGGNWAGRGRISLIKKIYQVMGWVQVDSVRVELGFRSNTIGFFRFSNNFESDQVEFRILMGFISAFGLLGSGLGRVSGHMISGNFGFQIISGRTGLCQIFFIIFYFGSDWILNQVEFWVVRFKKKIS